VKYTTFTQSVNLNIIAAIIDIVTIEINKGNNDILYLAIVIIIVSEINHIPQPINHAITIIKKYIKPNNVLIALHKKSIQNTQARACGTLSFISFKSSFTFVILLFSITIAGSK